MAATAEGLKRYLRVQTDSEEELTEYLYAAIAYCRNGGVAYREDDPLYDLLIYKLAAQEYDNRGLSAAGTDMRSAEENRQRMLNSFMLNLRYAAAPDTGGG